MICKYFELSNKRAGHKERAELEKKYTLLLYTLLIKSINEHGGIFRRLIETLRTGWIFFKNVKQACSFIRKFSTVKYSLWYTYDT